MPPGCKAAESSLTLPITPTGTRTLSGEDLLTGSRFDSATASATLLRGVKPSMDPTFKDRSVNTTPRSMTSGRGTPKKRLQDASVGTTPRNSATSFSMPTQMAKIAEVATPEASTVPTPVDTDKARLANLHSDGSQDDRVVTPIESDEGLLKDLEDLGHAAEDMKKELSRHQCEVSRHSSYFRKASTVSSLDSKESGVSVRTNQTSKSFIASRSLGTSRTFRLVVPPPKDGEVRSRASTRRSILSMNTDELEAMDVDIEGAASSKRTSQRSSQQESIVGEGAVGDKVGAACSLESREEQEMEDGATYAGQWRGALQHGRGRFVNAAGDRYDGNFEEGAAHGYGILQHADGHRYEGQWQSGHAHGHGKFARPDGNHYEGAWVLDEKQGKGREEWADGTVYDGEFFEGMKHGQGRYLASEEGGGGIYEGQFADDEQHGQGSYRFADGRVYIGQWRKGHCEGQGRMEWPNGCSYVGSYEDDRKNGFGKYSWPDGRKYIGQWADGKMHGKGTIMDSKGQERSGEFSNGKVLSWAPGSFNPAPALRRGVEKL